MSGAGTEDGFTFGIGARLYSACLTLFSALSLEVPALRDPCDTGIFNEELGRFYLWGEGFRGSKLDVLLGAFPGLGDSILRHLVRIGTLLRDNTDFSKNLSYGLRNAAGALESTIESAERIISSQQDLDALPPAKDDGASDTSSSSRSSTFELLDDLHFYVGLLMSLIPSMDRCLTQVAKDREQQQVDAPSDNLRVSPWSSGTAVATSSKSPSSRGKLRSDLSAGSSVESRPDDRRDSTTVDASGKTDLDPDAATMTEDFRHALSLEKLEAPSAERLTKYMPSGPQPPPYTVISSLPLVPTMPSSKTDLKFRNLLLTLSEYPLKYENPGLLDEALLVVPVGRIHSDAEEEHQVLKAIAASCSDEAKTEWGYEDCVVISLLRWFRREFFSYVSNPICPICSSSTKAQGYTPRTDDEAAFGAVKVELYKCDDCGRYERFPRYSDVWTLLRTRKGRVGEFANCFGMFCRAFGTRVRWVWNSEDHVWIEVFSEHKKRWVHVDPCEETFDRPGMYTEGWGRKLAYCIAFSIDGATDVTRRYVRDRARYGLPRTRTSEEVLLWIMLEIRKNRREGLDKARRAQLLREDAREERELQSYIAKRAVQQVLGELANSNTASDDLKPRQSNEAPFARTISDADTGPARYQY